MFTVNEIILAIFEQVHLAKDDLGHFASLATVNKAVSDVVIRLLWKELPSMMPLIHLLPDDAVTKQRDSSGLWHFVSHNYGLVMHYC